MMLKLIAWEVLCLALLWSVFCRSVRTSTTTKISIRLAIWLLGLSALTGLGAPVYGWEPDLVTFVMVTSIVILQLATAHHWFDGVPDPFTDSRFLPRQRRKQDRI